MVRVFNDLESLSQAAATMLVELAGHAMTTRQRFSLSLSGGETPRRLYEMLAADPFRQQIDWQFVHVFWGDERCVPAGDPRSNARMARQTLLDHIPIPTSNIHSIQGDLPPAQAADRYEAELRRFFASQPPVFDLILLGLGDNGHTASLFPHTPVLDEHQRWAAEVFLAEQVMYRVTLTAPVINQAHHIVFLVSGAGKAPALKNVLEGPYQPHELPAQLILQGEAKPLWLVDKAAALELTTEYKDVV